MTALTSVALLIFQLGLTAALFAVCCTVVGAPVHGYERF
jgi:hypothetical protein